MTLWKQNENALVTEYETNKDYLHVMIQANV